MNDSTADYTPRLFFSIDSVLPYPRSGTIDTSQRGPGAGPRWRSARVPQYARSLTPPPSFRERRHHGEVQ